MTRDTEALKRKAIAEGKKANEYKQHALQFEEELKKTHLELESVKEESANKEKALRDHIDAMGQALENSKTAIRVMVSHIFDKPSFFSAGSYFVNLVHVLNETDLTHANSQARRTRGYRKL